MGVIALITVVAIGGSVFMAYRFQHKAEQYTVAIKDEAPVPNTYNSPTGIHYLPDAMDELGDPIRKSKSSFQLSFKKADSDGTSYSLEEDLTPL